MDYVNLLVIMKTLHVLMASLWIGGILFTIVVNRGLRRVFNPVDATKTLSIIGISIQKPMRFSLYTTIATGVIVLLMRVNISPHLFNITFYTTQLGLILLAKITVVIMILALLPLHSKLGKATYHAGDRGEFMRARRKTLVVGWATLFFSILAVYFGTGLRFS